MRVLTLLAMVVPALLASKFEPADGVAMYITNRLCSGSLHIIRVRRGSNVTLRIQMPL